MGVHNIHNNNHNNLGNVSNLPPNHFVARTESANETRNEVWEDKGGSMFETHGAYI